MHLIVTHANADFDAIASLLGAHRLYPEAIPLLPFTINRNVRDFITLYENQLPFIHANELSHDLITRLTIVDTQHPPQLKNLSPNVAIHIIDHHELSPNIPPGAVLSLTDAGAVSTLLVEQLRDLGTRLSPLEATLLLLGIYEDTGSLTYASTTARDLYAAAWLLDKHHAQLDLVRSYLNYAMNPDQVALYEELVNHLETHLIHGQTIILAMAEVDHHVAEISGIAHRLRDLYSPAALFLMVKMVDHIQLVARSTTHEVDVGRIAEKLGGGGHQRAAAAAMRYRTLTETRLNLLQALHEVVQPAVIVEQIMSKGVHTLAPTDTIRYAAQMMDWYGHEGFPVMAETGKIVGMLSRREVDKARRHQLDGAPIYQFMTKGEFYVQPHDGLEAVRALMVEQRIGQVPVISPDNGEIMGIVTRTDLLNLRQSTDATHAAPLNLATALAQHISPQLFNLLQDAGHIAAQQHDTLYLVGGFVRDLLLMMSPTMAAQISPRFDLDLVVEGNAIALAEALQQKYGGRVHAHQRFGTAKWLLTEPIAFNAAGTIKLTSLDFVTARTEFYRHPSALPEVERSSIRHDLHRRDFTINTLAMGLSATHTKHVGDLLDFYGGQNDLTAGLIRVLHSLSFVEDPTRMLRAARLLARLNFRLEERTAELLTNALDLLDRVSAERIWHELELIFKEHQPAPALQQLQQLGILAAIHPDLVMDDWLDSHLSLLTSHFLPTPYSLLPTPYSPLHYLGLMLFRLSESAQIAILERLNLRTSDRKIIQQSRLIRDQADEIMAATRASHLYQLLELTSFDARLIAWLGEEKIRAQLVRFETELQHVKPIFDGTRLMAEFKLPRGPLYGQILGQLRVARLDGQITTLEDERAMIGEMISKK